MASAALKENEPIILNTPTTVLLASGQEATGTARSLTTGTGTSNSCLAVIGTIMAIAMIQKDGYSRTFYVVQ